MLLDRRSSVRIASFAVVALVGLDVAFTRPTPASAQCDSGEFALRQSGIVGWVCVSGDHSSEWWAYIDGQYQWADSLSIGTNIWHCDAEYLGSGSWTSYAAWKADVLSRAEAIGHTVTFQQHAVVEESLVD